jgi:hypothetical protein
MRHPSEGVLRRLLDEPAGVADADREHVATCGVCLSGLAAVREDAALVEEALAMEGDAEVDVSAAWRHLAAVETASGAERAAAPPRAGRSRAVLRRPVAAAVAVAVVLGGAGAAAAAGWLQIFRTEQIAPVTVTQADLVELPDLSAYGDVEVISEPDVRQVADAAAAEDATGVPVPHVAELPRGVTGEPVFQVGDQVSAVFTFSEEKAARTAAAAGETLPPPPEGLHGSQFRLVAGPGVAALWSSTSGVPALVVGRAVAPTGYSSGVPFETAREYLLSLPGLPEDVAAQLRSFSADGTTLPLPVPADEMTTSAAEVNGMPATVLTSRDGTMAAVVWVEDGVVTAVAGSLSADEVLSVAGGLR